MDSNVAIVENGRAILAVTETYAMNVLEMRFFSLTFSDSRKRESKMFYHHVMKKRTQKWLDCFHLFFDCLLKR